MAHQAAARAEYLRALLAEIRIIVRTIAADSEKSLAAVRIRWTSDEANPGAPPVELSYPDVIPWITLADDLVRQALTQGAATPPAQNAPQPEAPAPPAPNAAPPAAPAEDLNSQILRQTARLQFVRDALVSAVRPATGLSIAYTTLIAGDDRDSGKRTASASGTRSESRASLAEMAYPALRRTASGHKWFIFSLCVMSLALALFASWQATRASLGKNLLQPLEQLRLQQQAIQADKFKLEVRLEADVARWEERRAQPAKPDTPAPMAERPYPPGFLRVPVCDRHGLEAAPAGFKSDEEIRYHFNADIRDVCEKDSVIGKNIARTQARLTEFKTYWPQMVGGLYLITAQVIDGGLRLLRFPDRVVALPPENTCRKSATTVCPSADVELDVAPMIAVITNFVLPVTMGIIGSLLFVILDHYTRMRNNLLIPKDFPLAFLRVTLGIVVAICVSLMISGSSVPVPQGPLAANGSVPPGSIVGSLTLSASLITFLAGFASEAVFSLLQALALSVFAVPKREK